MANFVTGERDIFNRLMRQKSKMLDKVAHAVELTVNDVANHAKANHVAGSNVENFNQDIVFAEELGMFGSFGSSQASTSGLRYINRTGTLTRSITPSLDKVDFESVEGSVHTNIEYAMNVEFGTSRSRAHPFMFPALLTGQPLLIKRLKGLAR